MKTLESAKTLQIELIYLLDSGNYEKALFVNEEIETLLKVYDQEKTNSELEEKLLEQMIDLQDQIDKLFEKALLEEKENYYVLKTKIRLLDHFNSK